MKSTFTKHLLTLVLLGVFVWYTAVNPVSDSTVIRGVNGDSPDDAEERSAGSQMGAVVSLINGELKGDTFMLPQTTAASVDDLDWPEIIAE